MNKKYILYVLSALISSADLFAPPFQLKDHALPKGSIRSKLDTIFNGCDATPAAVTSRLGRRRSFVDLQSWHWLVGKLTTGSGQPFIIKTAKYAPGDQIPNPNAAQLPEALRAPLVHGTRQNISRLATAAQVRAMREREGMTKVKVPQSWVYPISGNDNDLDAGTTDTEVVIVEEAVEASPSPEQYGNSFADVVKLARNGILDLHQANVVFDADGNMVLIDLEDLLSRQREEIAQSNFLLRPFKRHKLNCLQEVAALCPPVMASQGYLDQNIKIQGGLAGLAMFKAATVKMYAPEITTAAMTIIALVGRSKYSNFIVRKLINKCQQELAHIKADNQGGVLDESICVEKAKEVVTKFAEEENRQEIFNAFAVVKLAEEIKASREEGDARAVIILGKTYDSPEKAIAQSLSYIDATWRYDRSIRSAVVSLVKKTGVIALNAAAQGKEYLLAKVSGADRQMASQI